MSNFIENLGLEFLLETEDDVDKLMCIVAREGTPIIGYYGAPYLNLHFGDAQFIARTEIDQELRCIQITGLDTHSSGSCIWKSRVSGIAISPKDAENTQRKCILKRMEDGSGMAVVNIVNADVLPSFLDNDEITLQMVAFPTLIEYFCDEDEYAEHQPEQQNGEKWLVSDGSIFPAGFMRNHDPENPEAERNGDIDDLTLIRGTVKTIYWGTTKFGEQKYDLYIRCIIETQFGDLELIHTIEQVAEEQRMYIKPGCVVSGVFVLSGDAAIHEYDKGIVWDEEHHLRALRHTFVKGEAERIRYILDEGAVYVSDASEKEYHGRDEIIDHLRFVCENAEKECFAQMATIISVDEDSAYSGPPEYAVGKRCVVLSEEREDNYISIAFIDLDGENRITKLHISTDGRYQFKCDQQPEYADPFENIELPEDVTEPMIMRARYHGIIGNDTTKECVLEHIDNCSDYKNNAKWMLDALQDNPQPDMEEAYKNIFGYLFAKAIEGTENKMRHDACLEPGLFVSYIPDDAFRGIIETELDKNAQEKIEKAMMLGKQFYNDFKFYAAREKLNDDKYNNNMLRSLVIVQMLGQMYTEKCIAR